MASNFYKQRYLHRLCIGKYLTNKQVLTVPDNDGILIQYARMAFIELSKRTGISITIKERHKKRGLFEANKGDYDGVAMRVIGLEKDYPNLRRVRVSVISAQHIIFAKRLDIINKVKDFDGLYKYVSKNNYTVAYLHGSKKAKD